MPVARPRVVERLQAAGRQPIVLVVAPAGYGKSVAMRQYLATLSVPSIRFDCGSEHATLLGFLRGLCEAIVPHAPHAAATLAGAYDRSRASVTPSADLALWMESHLSGFDGVVAIDDLHVAEADRTVAEFVAALIERSKDAIAWVIASRSTAGLPIGTWLAYGDTDLAIDERDLRFTLDEARAAARRLPLGDPQRRVRRTAGVDGWLADRPEFCTAQLDPFRRSAQRGRYDARHDLSILRRAGRMPSSMERSAICWPSQRRCRRSTSTCSQAAGFDRALAIVEGLRERTAFIFAEFAAQLSLSRPLSRVHSARNRA